MFTFVIGMIAGVVLTFTLAAITDESTDGMEYDEDFDDYYIDEEDDEWEDETVD